MKICFVEDGLRVGGSHISLYYLVRGLLARGVEAVVSVPEPHAWHERFTAMGARVDARRPGRAISGASPKQAASPTAAGGAPASTKRAASYTNSGLYRTLSFYKNYWAGHRRGVDGWRRYLGTLAPDLVHTNNALPINFEAAVAAKSLGLPLVCHMRGFQPIRRPHRAFLKRMPAGVAISDVIRSYYLSAGAPADRITKVYDGIDLGDYSFREPCGEIPTAGGRILFLGRLVGWKGAPVLLDALSRLRSTRADLSCVIAGDGPDRAGWEADVRARGLEEVVRFAGFVSDVIPLLHEADVLVHTSITPEPLGRVTLEGMAAGTPVVASAHGASPELIDDGITGWLATPGDPSVLAEKIESALSAGSERIDLARRARARVESDFTTEKMVDGFWLVVRRLVG
jgi:glycosyltransferase involved in cell wall biosynthesis